MSEASRAHNRIATDLTIALGLHLRGSGYRIASSDTKVRLSEKGSRYYYPDLVLSCSPPEDEPDEHTETRPVLLVEILPPSTALIDRREKRLAYQTLPTLIDSLIDSLIVSQDTADAELFTRDGDGWTRATFTASETIELGSIGSAGSRGPVTSGR